MLPVSRRRELGLYRACTFLDVFIPNIKCNVVYMTKAYCVKCKAKRDLVNPKEKKTKNNRVMIQGTCEKCGTKAQVFVASK